MTRTNTDTIIGIVGAVAIVFTLVGVFAYEYNNIPEDEEEPEPGIPSESESGDLDQDGSVDLTFTPDEGVTAITMVIDWTPTAPSGVDALAGYTYELRDPADVVIDSGSSIDSATLTVSQPVAGEYTLTLSAPSPSLGGSYDVEATYDY